MPELDFTIEMNAEGVSRAQEAELFDEADRRLRDLTENHTDLTGASITLREPAKGETGFLFEATVVTYVRPDNVVATEKHENPELALKGALRAVERQVREKRGKLGEPWQRPDLEP